MAVTEEQKKLQGVVCYDNISYYAIVFDGTVDNTAPIYTFLNNAVNAYYKVTGENVAVTVDDAQVLADTTKAILCNISNSIITVIDTATLESAISGDSAHKGYCEQSSGGGGGGASGPVNWDDIQGKPSFGTLATKNTVSTNDIADNAITTNKIADANITSAKLAEGAVDLTSNTVTGMVPLANGGFVLNDIFGF